MSFRILCISHDASLTGAPRVLLHFVRWVHAQQLAEVEVLLQEGGPLASQFASLVPTVQLPLEGWRRYFHPFAWLRERRNGLTENIALQRERVGKGAYDLVLANTVASGAAVAALAPFRSPLICWVHELEQMIARVERQRSFSTILHHCDRFVAASQAVKNNLLQCHALPTEQVAVAHEFVQCEEVTPAQRSRFSRELHQEIGAPPEALIVGGCGTTDWRKGPDLFLEVAAEVVRLRPNAPVHFVWLGGNPFRQWPSEIRQGLPPPQ